MAAEECYVASQLAHFAARDWPIVLHPDAIFTDSVWLDFGDRILLENNDKRKSVGRTDDELKSLFERFPNARFCFDIGHARQVDPTMNEAHLILRNNQSRLGQVHLSEVNFFSRHDPLSAGSIEASRRVAHLVPENVPIILETLIDQGQSTIETQLDRAVEALRPAVPAAV